MMMVREGPPAEVPIERSSWPDKQTVATAVMVVVNVIFELLKTSLLITGLGNIAVRLYSSLLAYQEGSYGKIVFNVIALALLFFPHGRLIAVGLDLVWEGVNCYRSYTPTLRSTLVRPDPSTREGALQTLGLSEEEARSASVLDRRRSALRDVYLARVSPERRASPFLVREAQIMLENIETAYRTLYRTLQVAS